MDDFKQAQENLDFLSDKGETVKLKTLKDSIKDVLKKIHPIRREKKLHEATDIQTETRIKIRDEFRPKVDMRKSKKGLIDCKLELDFGYEFENKNVIVDVSIDGEMFKLISNKGSSEFIMYGGIAKRF